MKKINAKLERNEIVFDDNLVVSRFLFDPIRCVEDDFYAMACCAVEYFK